MQLFSAASADIQKNVRGPFFEATAFPSSDVARQLPETIHELSTRLESIPDPPDVPKIIGADKHRLLAYLYIAEARLDGALADSKPVPGNDDFRLQRTKLARASLQELSKASKFLQEAENPSDSEYSAELKSAIQKSQIHPHIQILKVTAHSILWIFERNKADKKAAREAWSQIGDAQFQSEYGPSPEVEKTLDIGPPQANPASMTPVSWTGIALLVVGLIAAIFVRNANLFQQWAVRVIIAIGAAMAATVIPGLLNINIPGYIAAGGALAVIVLIYLRNPPTIR
jgi:hypothetical protein